MKKAVIPVLLAITLLLTGCDGQGDADKPIEERITPVETTLAGSATITRELIYAGQVMPSDQVYVMPKLGGKVAEVYFDVGDSVNKDDVLFEIEDTDIQSAINAAQASYSASLAGVATARAGLDSVAGGASESTLLNFETAVTNAEVALENAQNTLKDVTTAYENTKALYEAGAASKTAYDDVESKYNSALNNVTLSETSLSHARENLELYKNKTHGTNIRQAQSSVNQAAAGAEATKVSLENALRNLEDLKVKSPITGVVSAKNVTVGGMAGQTSPAFTVINVETIEISTNISEELINVIAPGMVVPVDIKAAGDEPFKGVISTISPAADEVKKTYPVKITIENPDEILKPGMFAEVHFTKEKSENTVVMPRNTVLDEGGSKYVFVAENDMARKYFVETGIDNGKEIEITGGLPQGAQIITKGQTQVTDGEKIKIVGSK